MKHNIIFALLTAAILVSGFFAIDIVQIFSSSNNDEGFRSISKTEDNAVYLSSEREIINPMTIINKSNKKVNSTQREIASAVVSAMSRYNKTTYIAWGIDTKLYEAWQDGGNDLIYIDKWKYKNYGKKSERLLDCIIDTNDYNIIYIRFYSEEVHELPASDLNKGLNKIRNLSNEFYPNIEIIELTMQDVLDELKLKMTEREYDPNFYGYYEHEFYEYIGEEIQIYFPDYIYRYTDMQKFVDFVYPNSELHNFWLSPLDMCNSILTYYEDDYSDQSDMNDTSTRKKEIVVEPVNYILYEFIDAIPQWFTPSYSTKDGRIYQTITLNDGKKVTVIYSVKEDMVEGFYFEGN